MNFKKTVCAAVAIITAAQCNNAVLASELTARLSYGAQKSEIMISGQADEAVVLLILPEGSTPAESDDSSEKTYFDVISPVDGRYELNGIKFPEKVPTGNYTAYVSTAKADAVETTFHYVNINDLKGIIDEFNAASTTAALRKVTEANADIFAIDTADEGYKAASEELYKIFLQIKSEYSQENAGAVYDELYSALAMAYMEKTSRAVLEQMLSERAANLGISYETEYNDSRLSESAKEELASMLSAAVYSDEIVENGKVRSFSEILCEKKILAAVRTAESWQRLKQIIMSDFEQECRSFTDNSDFKSLKNSDSVFSEMIKRNYGSFKALESGFSDAVKNAKNSEKSQGGASGGSSGGSGSSGGGSSISYVQPSGSASTVFSDLSSAHWAYDKIERLCGKGIISGYPDNTFRPDNNVTRAELVKMLMTVVGTAVSYDDVYFNDASPEDWFYESLINAARRKIVFGDTEGNFRANEYVTRQDAAVMLERALESAGSALSEGEPDFYDMDQIDGYAQKSVGKLFSAGVIRGDDQGFFNPKAGTKRSEAASMIYNAFYK